MNGEFECYILVPLVPVYKVVVLFFAVFIFVVVAAVVVGRGLLEMYLANWFEQKVKILVDFLLGIYFLTTTTQCVTRLAQNCVHGILYDTTKSEQAPLWATVTSP